MWTALLVQHDPSGCTTTVRAASDFRAHIRSLRARSPGSHATGKTSPSTQENSALVGARTAAPPNSTSVSSTGCKSKVERLMTLEHVCGGGLLLQRFRKIVGARLHFVEQPHVLDGDHGLVGEGGHQLDLLVVERLDAAARQRDDADRLALAHQRHAEHRAHVADLGIVFRRVVVDLPTHRRCGQPASFIPRGRRRVPVAGRDRVAFSISMYFGSRL